MKHSIIFIFILAFSAICFSQDTTAAKLKIGIGAGYSTRVYSHSKHPNTVYNPGISFAGDIQYNFTNKLFLDLNYHHTSHGIDRYNLDLQYKIENVSLSLGYLQPLSANFALSADIGAGITRGKYPDYEIFTYHEDSIGYDYDMKISKGPALAISGNADIVLHYRLNKRIDLQLGVWYAISKISWHIDALQFSYTGYTQPYYGTSGGTISDELYQYLDYMVKIQYAFF